MSERHYIKRCLQEILVVNNLPKIENLTQRDFEFLSIEIETKTAILISVSTIKRLLYGNFSKIPQTATLSAISSYLGYKSWHEYKLHAIKNSDEYLEDIPEGRLWFQEFKVYIFAISSIFLVLLLIIILPSKNSKNYESAKFSAKKTTQNQIPNTVIFNFDIDKVKADSFFIQQSWDVNRRNRIDKNQHTLTDIYYEPGQHTAKLIANDSIIKTFSVNIPTDKWLLYSRYLTKKDLPIYFKNDLKIKNFLQFTDKNLIESHINPLEDKVYFVVNFPSRKLISSESFIFESRIKLSNFRKAQCPFLMNEIFTEHQTIYIKSTEKGCASEANAQLSENYVSGKTNDNLGLCADLEQWTNFRIESRKKTIRVFINHKKVFENHYKKDAGEVKGIGFLSNGLLQIDYVKLLNLDGTNIFVDDF